MGLCLGKILQNILKILHTDHIIAPTLQVVLNLLRLPFYNGYHWCAQIRQVSQVPVIFVSSAGDNMNIVMAVNMGGDDFVTKPFEPEVLAATSLPAISVQPYIMLMNPLRHFFILFKSLREKGHGELCKFLSDQYGRCVVSACPDRWVSSWRRQGKLF